MSLRYLQYHFYHFFIFLFLWTSFQVRGQNIDSLSQKISAATDYKEKTELLNQLGFELTFTDPQQAYLYSQRAFWIADSLELIPQKAAALVRMGVILYRRGNPSESLKKLVPALRIYQRLKDSLYISRTECLIGNAYLHFQSYNEAIKHYQSSIKIGEQINNKERICVALKNIGRAYNRSNRPEKALLYLRQALAVCEQDTSKSDAYTSLLSILGSTYYKLNKYDDAVKYLEIAYRAGEREGQLFVVSDVGIQLAEVYVKSEHYKKAETYALKSIDMANQAAALSYLTRAYQIMYDIRKAQNENDEALYYLELHDKFQDSVFNAKRLSDLNDLSEGFELYKKEKENELLKNKQYLQAQKIRNRELVILGISGGLLLASLLAYIFFRGRLVNKKAKLLLKEKNDRLRASEEELRQQAEELLSTNDQLEVTLSQLKDTQSQLVQAEKIATLGQLTANIAHEINNPLGAVQSAASFIQQALQEAFPSFHQLFNQLDKPTQQLFWQQYRASTTATPLKFSTKELRTQKKAILVKLDELAIIAPKKVAESIAHMRKSANWEYLTPLLRHPMSVEIFDQLDQLVILHQRSQIILQAVNQASRVMYTLKSYSGSGNHKRSSFNLIENINSALQLYKSKMQEHVELVKNYNTESPSLLGYPEELRQVWSNLFVNALQAMDYKGKLSITVLHKEQQFRVSIEDSGIGIPEQVKDQIFTPFFTTKPQGEGSGLGLDISKRIIEKHQGSISVESKEGIGTKFTVQLPILKEF